MSDLLSPILYVTQNEVDAFWCFCGFMELVVSADVGVSQCLCVWSLLGSLLWCSPSAHLLHPHSTGTSRRVRKP